jgi:hypothetical protein
MAGAAFIALQTAQTVGRLSADRVVTRFGDRAVARAGAATTGLAMTAAPLLPTPTTTVVAFGLVGLGIATLMPATARAAAALPGLPPGTGLMVIGSVDRVALIVGTAGWRDRGRRRFRVGLALIPVATAMVLLLSVALRNRHTETKRYVDREYEPS